MARLSLLALAVVLMAFALTVWRARPQASVHRWFAAFTAFISVWAFGISGLQGASHLDEWGKVAFAGAAMIPASFLAFMTVYPSSAATSLPGYVRIALAVAAVMAALSVLTSWMVYDTVMTPHGLTRKTGPLYPAFSLVLVLTWLAALPVFVGKLRRARGLARAQIQYLGAGVLGSAALAMGINLLLPLVTGSSAYSWLGPYAALFLLLVVGHAILRHRLLDLRVVLHRGLAYALVVLMAAAGVTVAGRLGSARWQALAFPGPPDILAFVLVALLLVSPPALALLRPPLDRYLNRGRIDLEGVLQHATRRTSRLMHPDDLSRELTATVASALSCSFCVIAIGRASTTGGLVHVSGPAAPPPEDLPTLVEVGHRLLASRASPAPLIVDPSRAPQQAVAAHEHLRQKGVDLLAPLWRRNELLGLLIVGAKRSGDAYFASDLDFLQSLLEVAAISFENAMLHRNQLQILEYSTRLLESIDSAVVSVDTDGQLTSFNPAAARLLGLTAADRHGFLSRLPDEVAWALAFALVDGSRLGQTELAVSAGPEAAPRPVVLSTDVLRDAGGGTLGAFAILVDISHLKQLEENKRRLQHLSTMARLYAGIAHEIRTPLTSISSFVSLLPDHFDDPDYRSTALRLLPAEVHRIVRLADRLRLMAPSESASMGPLDLTLVLRDLVDLHAPVAADQGIDVRLAVEPDLPLVHGDRAQLIQLFSNLLRNALEAVAAGGHVWIEASRRAFDGGPGVVVTIADDGTGLDPRVRGHLFEPFFTTKPAGTGLGLSICREIATLHGARLGVAPRPAAAGTVATVELPGLARAAAPRGERRPVDRVLT